MSLFLIWAKQMRIIIILTWTGRHRPPLKRATIDCRKTWVTITWTFCLITHARRKRKYGLGHSACGLLLCRTIVKVFRVERLSLFLFRWFIKVRCWFKFIIFVLLIIYLCRAVDIVQLLTTSKLKYRGWLLWLDRCSCDQYICVHYFPF